MPIEGRYSHHMDYMDTDYTRQYGYDIDHLYEWSLANDPDFHSMEDILSYNLNVYGHIVAECLGLGITSVADIGCGCGQQSKMFAESDIDYIGIEPSYLPFYGEDRTGCSILRASYPECGNPGAQAAISSHCMGTGVLWEPEAIADDFDVFIGNCYQEFFDELREFYPDFMVIEAENLGYHPEAVRIPMMIGICSRL
jgi:hypothetical protein